MVQLPSLIQTSKEQQGNWPKQPVVLHIMSEFQIGDDPVQPASILVILQPGRSDSCLLSNIDCIPVGTHAATAQELDYSFISLSDREGILPKAGPPPINYVPPDPGEVTLFERGFHAITCHLGPDSGWSTQKPYL